MNCAPKYPEAPQKTLPATKKQPDKSGRNIYREEESLTPHILLC